MDRSSVRAMRGCVVIVLAAVGGIFYWLVKSGTGDLNAPGRFPGEPGMEGEEQGQPLPAEGSHSKRLKEVQALRKTRPEMALTECRKLVQDSKTPSEQTSALRVLSECMEDAFQDRLKQEKFEEADALVTEIQEWYPDCGPAQKIRRAWVKNRFARAFQALKADQLDTAQKLFSDAGSLSEGREDHNNWREYEEFLVKKWKAARAAGDEEGAMQILLAAASAFPRPEGARELMQALESDWPDETLVATGESLFEQEEYSAALCFLRTATQGRASYKLKLSAEEREALQGKIDQCCLLLGRRAQEAGRRSGGDGSAEDFFNSLGNSKSAARRIESHQAMLDMHAAEGRELAAAKKYKQAEERFASVLKRDAVQLWDARSEEPGFDPWAGVPKPVLDLVTERYQGLNEDRRLDILRQLARSGEFEPPIPEAEAIRHKDLPGLYAQWGLQLLKEHLAAGKTAPPDEAMEKLRGVMRANPDSEAAGTITDALRDLIRKSSASQAPDRFDRLVDLGGFYVAEVGPPGSTDPFRDELKKTLQAAAEGFRTRSPIQRTFLLTLLADAFPGDPAADAARNEVVALGLQVASESKPEAIKDADTKPSGMPGLSVHTIENDTPHYLLSFYDGPERFFVRLAPRRRGTVVLKDGKYVTAVMAIAEGIRPYRGDAEWSSEVVAGHYVVHTSGDGANWTPPLSYGSSTSGNYNLLRAPEGAGSFEVDPRNGMVGAGPGGK